MGTIVLVLRLQSFLTLSSYSVTQLPHVDAIAR